MSFPIPLKEMPIAAVSGRYIGPEAGAGEKSESGFIKSGECGGTVADPSCCARSFFACLAAEAEQCESSATSVLDAGVRVSLKRRVWQIWLRPRYARHCADPLPPEKAGSVLPPRGTWAVTAQDHP